MYDTALPQNMINQMKVESLPCSTESCSIWIRSSCNEVKHTSLKFHYRGVGDVGDTVWVTKILSPKISQIFLK